MRKYQVICVHGASPVQWAVVAVDPGGLREWLSFYPTQAEAQAAVCRLDEVQRQYERFVPPKT